MLNFHVIGSFLTKIGIFQLIPPFFFLFVKRQKFHSFILSLLLLSTAGFSDGWLKSDSIIENGGEERLEFDQSQNEQGEK